MKPKDDVNLEGFFYRTYLLFLGKITSLLYNVKSFILHNYSPHDVDILYNIFKLLNRFCTFLPCLSQFLWTSCIQRDVFTWVELNMHSAFS